MNKQNVGWIFATVGLSICLIVSIALGLSGYFFSVSFSKQATDLVVGDNVVINAKPNQAEVVSFTFDGNFLPGEVVPQVVQISAQGGGESVVLRVRGQIFGIEDNVEFVASDNFEEDRGFYYLKGSLQSGGKVAFCSHIKVPDNSKFVCGEKYVLSIVVETIDDNLDWQNIWKKTE